MTGRPADYASWPRARQDKLFAKNAKAEQARSNGDESYNGDPQFTEDRLALDFAEKHSPDLRYVAAWGKWLTWTETHWEIENTLRVFDMTRKICRDAASRCNKPSEAKALAKAKTVAAVEMLSRSDRRIAATNDQWDASHCELPRACQPCFWHS